MKIANTNAARADELRVSDGTTAAVRDDAIEIRDAVGRLLVRYVDGAAEISAPAGDLRLVAPAGRVVIRSALDVEIEAGRDVAHRAARELTFAVGDDAPRLAIDADATQVRARRLGIDASELVATAVDATLTSSTVTTVAERATTTSLDHTIVADRIAVRARTSLREIAELAEERLGRVRALVAGVYALKTRRTEMRSDDDTSIDGSRVLLG